MKTLTDKYGKPIRKGTIVAFGDGWKRVQSVSVGNKTVNLATVFGGYITHKKVPLKDICENEAAFMESWSKSESYQCM